MTGGTIDCYFDPIQATTIPNKESSIPQYLQAMIKPSVQLTAETVFMKDSRDLNDEDRTRIWDCIKKSAVDKIIIAHGTDAMQETAEFLLEKGAHALNKVMVITGAFFPLQGFAPSDAGFNLGYAFHAAQTLAPGLYVCMNGEVFPAGEVVKDRSNARFVKKV